MNLDFTKEQELLRKSVSEFLSKECPFEKVKEIEDSKEGYNKKHWKKMSELGWMDLYFPEEYGGYGDPFLNLMIIMEEIGKGAFPSPYFSTVILCGLTLLEGGSEDQKKTLLSKIATGNLIMAQAQYEKEPGYEEMGIDMPAELSGDQYVLNGTKMFVMDANIADKLIVAARLKNVGVTLFLVDSNASGIAISKMPAIGMDNTCEVIFKDVRVSVNDTIGAPGKGWDILQKMFPKAVILKCAEMVGGCKESLNMTADYAKKRFQYGKPIGEFQAIQHYMANMLLGYDTCCNYLYKTCWMSQEGMDVSKEIHVLKAHVNEQYKFITERAIQIHGGVGTTREFNPGLFYRRAKAFEYVLGDTQFHYEKLAEALDM